MFKRVAVFALLLTLCIPLSWAHAQSLNDLWRSSWGTCSGLPCLSISNATSSGPWTGNDTLNDLLKMSFATCSGVPCMRVSIDGGSSGVSIGSTVTGGTAGSVLFVGTGPVLAQDNAHLFYDATNHTLLLNTASSPLQAESGPYPLFSDRGNAIGVAGFLGIGNVPLLEFYRANGTFGTPTTVSPGDVLGGLRFYGHDGNSYADSDPAVV